MSLMWSGPGRALTAHLDLFEKIAVGERYLRENDGKQVRIAGVPPMLAQRARLMSAMSHEPLLVVNPDGDSPVWHRDDPEHALTTGNVLRATGLVRQEYDILNRGETHYVSHHVMETVTAAAAKAPDEMLFPTDLPAPRGLIVFEYPFVVDDLHPETGKLIPGLHMPIRAIGWNETTVYRWIDGEPTAGPGLCYVTYADVESYNKIHVEAVRRLVDPEAEPYEMSSILGMWVTDMSGWAFGVGWKDGGDVHDRGGFDGGEVHTNVAILRRFLLAYFRWTWDRIIIPTRADFTRPDRRRYERVFNRKLEDGYVKVMRLRREVEHEARRAAGYTDEYVTDHQWVVDGHWKRVHYATLGPARNEDGSFNHDSHRLKFIEPYIAGNPDGPLVVGHSVKSAVR